MGKYDLFRKIAQSNLTSKERDVNQMKYDILFDFEDSPSFTTALKNGVSQDFHIVDENAINKNPNKKRVLCKPDETISIGDDVVWNTIHWLCTNVDSDSTIQSKGIIEKCNNTFSIQTGTTKTLTGYDELGRPIYTEVPIVYSTPCIAITNLYSGKDNDTAINLPNGQLKISFKYNSTYNVTLGLSFQLYGFTYKIIDVDFTSVISNVGILSIMAQRQVTNP